MIARGEKYCRLGDLLDGADPARKRRPNVEPKQEVEGRPLDLEKGLRPVKAGIVDEDVEPRDGAEGGAHRRAVSDIEWHSLRLAAGRSNFPRDLDEVALCPADQNQLGAGHRHGDGDGTSTAAFGSGDERHLAVKAKPLSGRVHWPRPRAHAKGREPAFFLLNPLSWST